MAEIFIGTCGYSYKEWVGPFYPEGTKADDYLRYYAGQFRKGCKEHPDSKKDTRKCRVTDSKGNAKWRRGR